MIEFSYSPINSENTKQRLKRYPEVLRNEGLLKIIVNGDLWFIEPNFSVDEFLLYADKWVSSKEKSQNMLYYSADTDENPLISFIIENDRWYIDSTWRLFECNDSFTRDELENAVTELRKSVEH